MKYKDFLRKDKMPHIWCPGCGHGMVLSSFLRALAKREYHPDKVAVISGIGCSSRASVLNTCTPRTGLPFALSKMAKPGSRSLSSLVTATAYWRQSLIHAARRNIELTVIVFNNNIWHDQRQYSRRRIWAGDYCHGNIDYP